MLPEKLTFPGELMTKLFLSCEVPVDDQVTLDPLSTIVAFPVIYPVEENDKPPLT